MERRGSQTWAKMRRMTALERRQSVTALAQGVKAAYITERASPIPEQALTGMISCVRRLASAAAHRKSRSPPHQPGCRSSRDSHCDGSSEQSVGAEGTGEALKKTQAAGFRGRLNLDRKRKVGGGAGERAREGR